MKRRIAGLPAASLTCRGGLGRSWATHVRPVWPRAEQLRALAAPLGVLIE